MNLDESIRVQCFLNEAIFQVAADAGLIFFTFKEPRRAVKRICSGQIRRTQKALKKRNILPYAAQGILFPRFLLMPRLIIHPRSFFSNLILNLSLNLNSVGKEKKLPRIIHCIRFTPMTGGVAGSTRRGLIIICQSRGTPCYEESGFCRASMTFMTIITATLLTAHMIAMTPIERWGVKTAVTLNRVGCAWIGISIIPMAIEAQFSGAHRALRGCCTIILLQNIVILRTMRPLNSGGIARMTIHTIHQFGCSPIIDKGIRIDI